MAKPKAGIVGAGIAGASCAGALAAAGWDVDVFEKGPGAGGRLASRRLEAGWATLGAPFISAWNAPFREQADEWSKKGWVAPLTGDILQGRADTGWAHTQLKGHYLPTIDTSELVGHVLGQAKLHAGSRVIAVLPNTVVLEDGSMMEGYDQVICAVPGPQAIPLLDALPRLRDRLAGVRYRPVWAFLMRWVGGPEADIIKFDHNLMDMAVRQTAADPGLWLVHSSYEFAETIVEASEMEARTRAAAALTGLLGLSGPAEVEASHLWLYARPENAVGGHWLSDDDSRVALIGDSISGAGVERTWESGVQLAQAILQSRV
jgi:renalase